MRSTAAASREEHSSGSTLSSSSSSNSNNNNNSSSSSSSSLACLLQKVHAVHACSADSQQHLAGQKRGERGFSNNEKRLLLLRQQPRHHRAHAAGGGRQEASHMVGWQEAEGGGDKEDNPSRMRPEFSIGGNLPNDPYLLLLLQQAAAAADCLRRGPLHGAVPHGGAPGTQWTPTVGADAAAAGLLRGATIRVN
ncbi:hypothetical protein Efla_001804 [Eimeria flavescens]